MREMCGLIKWEVYALDAWSNPNRNSLGCRMQERV